MAQLRLSCPCFDVRQTDLSQFPFQKQWPPSLFQQSYEYPVCPTLLYHGQNHDFYMMRHVMFIITFLNSIRNVIKFEFLHLCSKQLNFLSTLGFINSFGLPPSKFMGTHVLPKFIHCQHSPKWHFLLCSFMYIFYFAWHISY